jgi:hypothetical protein
VPNKFIHNPKGLNDKLSKYIFLNTNTYFFFSNSVRDFYSENNSVSQVVTYITKIQKKNYKCYYRLCAPFCAKHWRHLCAIPLFVFPASLIWLLYCNAMHVDSFSLGARHLFQKLVLFFFV